MQERINKLEETSPCLELDIKSIERLILLKELSMILLTINESIICNKSFFNMLI